MTVLWVKRIFENALSLFVGYRKYSYQLCTMKIFNLYPMKIIYLYPKGFAPTDHVFPEITNDSVILQTDILKFKLQRKKRDFIKENSKREYNKNYDNLFPQDSKLKYFYQFSYNEFKMSGNGSKLPDAHGRYARGSSRIGNELYRPSVRIGNGAQEISNLRASLEKIARLFQSNRQTFGDQGLVCSRC